jgi:hypothetical protein
VIFDNSIQDRSKIDLDRIIAKFILIYLGIILYYNWTRASVVSASTHRFMYAVSSKTCNIVRNCLDLDSMLLGWDESTLRISSVPNRLRNMAESIALTDPIFWRHFIDYATNLERSKGARLIARDRNITLSKDPSEFRCSSSK